MATTRNGHQSVERSQGKHPFVIEGDEVGRSVLFAPGNPIRKLMPALPFRINYPELHGPFLRYSRMIWKDLGNQRKGS